MKKKSKTRSGEVLCIHKLKVSMVACSRSEKCQINHKFRMDGEVAHESLLLDEKLVNVGRCYERDSFFRVWSLVG